MPTNPPIVDGEIPSAAKWNTLVGTYGTDGAELDIVNTTVSTLVYLKTINAGDMSTDRMLRLTCMADWLNDTGTSQTTTVNVNFGGVTLASMGSSAAAAAARKSASFTFEIGNRNSASSQMIMYRKPDFTANNAVIQAETTAAVNTAVAVTLEVRVSHGAASPSLSWRSRYWKLELL